MKTLRHACSLLALLPFMTGCSDSSELTRLQGAGDDLFCATLENIRKNQSPHDSETNELIGHAANIKKLYEAAPEELTDDLLKIHHILSASRDAKGTDTLRAFQMLTNPNLAGYEGRVAQYVQDACGIFDGDTRYLVDTNPLPPSLCQGWPSTGSPLTNDRFPYLLDTSSANYFSNIFFSGPKSKMRPGMIYVPRGGRVTFRGDFPFSGYFGFHPNDMATNNLQTLMDVDIDPDSGSANPWRGPMKPGMGRRYTAHLVFDKTPDTPAPNTSYVGYMKSGKRNYATFNIYRVYDADLPSYPPNSAGVALPSVTVYDKNGIELEHHATCDPYPEGYTPPVDTTRFPTFPVPDHRAQSQAGAFGVKGNFGLEIDLLSNADVLYLSSFYGRMKGEVFAIRAQKPNTVNMEQGRHPWSDDLDFRLWTACTYNFWNGKANACVVDKDIPIDDDGYYTLLVTEPEHRPSNATRDHNVTWLDAGNFLDGQISFRMLPKNAPFLKKLKDDIANNMPSPYRPETAFCSRETFENGGFTACKLQNNGMK